MLKNVRLKVGKNKYIISTIGESKCTMPLRFRELTKQECELGFGGHFPLFQLSNIDTVSKDEPDSLIIDFQQCLLLYRLLHKKIHKYLKVKTEKKGETNE